jgi:hypothetical protein
VPYDLEIAKELFRGPLHRVQLCTVPRVEPKELAQEVGTTTPSRGNDQALTVHAEFVVVGGSNGEALEARQLAVIREILLWHQRKTASQATVE